MKALFTFATLSFATAIAAHAEQIVLPEELAGATLHSGDVDMSVYYLDAGTGFEVTATYVAANSGEAPARLVMLLQDGDAVSFGLPGERGMLYSFSRSETDVTVTATPTKTQYAAH